MTTARKLFLIALLGATCLLAIILLMPDKSDSAPQKAEVTHTKAEWDKVLPIYELWTKAAQEYNTAGHACHAWIETSRTGHLEVLFGCTS